MMVDTGIGVDRLAYHVYQEVFEQFLPDKQQVKSLMITYKSFKRQTRELVEAE